MKLKAFVLCLLLVLGTCVSAFGQTKSNYQLTKMTITPFDLLKGVFEPEITPDDTRNFQKQKDKSLFVVVEVSGPKGNFDRFKTIEITVKIGQTRNQRRTYQPGTMSETGKYYVPLWIENPICGIVTIQAKMLGQTNDSLLTRKVDFQCGQ
jgi:hypothetical protein